MGKGREVRCLRVLLLMIGCVAIIYVGTLYVCEISTIACRHWKYLQAHVMRRKEKKIHREKTCRWRKKVYHPTWTGKSSCSTENRVVVMVVGTAFLALPPPRSSMPGCAMMWFELRRTRHGMELWWVLAIDDDESDDAGYHDFSPVANKNAKARTPCTGWVGGLID